SMGGLIAQQYIESDQYQHDVDKLVFLGTPHLGAPSAYLIWEAGEIGPNSDIQADILKSILTQEATEKGYVDLFDYVHNKPVPSVKELLPAYDYIFDGAQLRHYPTNYPSNSFIENLEENLPLLNSSGVNVYNIIGNLGAQSTLTAIDATSTN